MSTPSATSSDHNAKDPSIEASAYEVLRQRLERQGETLLASANALNTSRAAVFGGQAMELVASERLRTENNCVARDMAGVGDLLFFAYNVFIGLRQDVRIEDVLACHRLAHRESGFALDPLGEADTHPLAHPQFVRDFTELFRFYKDARIVQLRLVGGLLLAIFQVGQRASDIKVFRWKVSPDGRVDYADNRGERDNTRPPAAPFEWRLCGREDQRQGAHPHVSIDDEIFVETVGGDLTIKVEDNTETGRGIYAEPVEYPDQTLDDAELSWARLDRLLLLRVRPYREDQYRYFLFNPITQKAHRIDELGATVAALPEGHGALFPGGYALITGEVVRFDVDTRGMQLDRVVRSPNGEDVLYAFHHHEDGRYLLMPYNLVRKEVSAPIACHGYSLFGDGTMLVFRSTSEEPTRVHPIGVWRTPFMSELHFDSKPRGASFLETVGNADLVRGISDCLSVCRLIGEQAPTLRTYETLLATVNRTLDTYHWLPSAEAGGLAQALAAIRGSALSALDEFAKVQTLRERASGALAEVREAQERLLRGLRLPRWTQVEPYIDGLTQLRTHRGHIATLRELRHIDSEALSQLDDAAEKATAELSQHTANFLRAPEALEPLLARLTDIAGHTHSIAAVKDAERVGADLEAVGAKVALLSETVAGLDVGDAGVRTEILDRIGELYGQVNRQRALLRTKRRELLERETAAQFAADLRLLAQSIGAALALVDSPEACDQQSARVLAQLEELGGRYGEFDEQVAALALKREEIAQGFAARKQVLVDERQRRASGLITAAERILASASRRGASFASEEELQTFFTTDPMIAKLRELVGRLSDMGLMPRADELQGRLAASKEEALRALRDKRDLYDAEGSMRLGQRRFAVSQASYELSLVPRHGQLALHIDGTDFYEPLADSEADSFRDVWGQSLVSESANICRAEFLAAQLLDIAAGGGGLPRLVGAQRSPSGLLDVVRQYAEAHAAEGYERGVHDADAARLLEKLLVLLPSAGPLRVSAASRALAALFWASSEATPSRTRWQARAASATALMRAFGHNGAKRALAAELTSCVQTFSDANPALERLLEGEAQASDAANFLVLSLGDGEELAHSEGAPKLLERLRYALQSRGSWSAFEAQLKAVESHPADAFGLAYAWLQALVNQAAPDRPESQLGVVVPEAAAIVATSWMQEPLCRWRMHLGLAEGAVDGLLSEHSRIQSGKLSVQLSDYLQRAAYAVGPGAERFRAWQQLRAKLLNDAQQRLRTRELKAIVMGQFVRNRLLDEVYLPLIGSNFARQLGTVGEGAGAARMGLLLLISPPGYGKTTLVEYVANRLGLALVKISGPALGHSVTSLDPAEAVAATARQEVERINLAFEMGNNVLLYLDDIQHTHPEFLQKFISLCDAQRRVEGVWQGQSRTYDMRGRRFAVVMAGNPYTEAGARFQIPDMLANRADSYNLGDILEGRQDLFELSYLENAFTSSPTLAPLVARSRNDAMLFLRHARGEPLDEGALEHDYSSVEREEFTAVLRRLWKVQGVLSKVNRAYIDSAAQDDAYRTEPPFKLQGSYRNMVKLAARVNAALDDEELERLIDDHYLGEAQTLTTGAEQNLLKLAALRGRLTPEQSARWEAMCKDFRRRTMLGGGDDDPVVRVTSQLSLLGQQVEAIAGALREGQDAAARLASQRAKELAHERAQLLAEARATEAKASAPAPLPAPQPVVDPATTEALLALARSLREAPMRLEIVNMPPPTIHELLSQQLQITEQLLVPLVRSAGHSIKGTKAVWDKLQEVLATLQAIDPRAAAAPDRRGTTVHPFSPGGNREPDE